MEMTNTDSLKEQLLMTDPEFRELAREHGKYDARLRELVTPNETRSPEARTYPGPSLEIARHHQLF